MSGEYGGGDFTGGEQMPKICASVAMADGAGTLRIDGALVLHVPRVLDEDAAFAGVETSVAGGARGEHTIHHVDTKAT